MDKPTEKDGRKSTIKKSQNDRRKDTEIKEKYVPSESDEEEIVVVIGGDEEVSLKQHDVIDDETKGVAVQERSDIIEDNCESEGEIIAVEERVEVDDFDESDEYEIGEECSQSEENLDDIEEDMLNSEKENERRTSSRDRKSKVMFTYEKLIESRK